MFRLMLVLALAQDPTPESVKSQIDELRPAKLAWADIAWKTCPLEAMAEARRSKRPIITWVFLGNPGDERC